MSFTKRATGWLAARRHRLDPNVRWRLDAIRHDLQTRLSAAPQTRKYVVLVGYSLAGKTTLRREHPQLQAYAGIETRLIHEHLNSALHFLRDDRTVRGPAYWERQWLTRYLRRELLTDLLGTGVSLVADSCHLERSARLRQFRLAKEAGYRTYLVWVICHPATHAVRLIAADDAEEAAGRPRTWQELVQTVQWQRFEPPIQGEADRLISFYSGLTNRSLYF